MNTTNNIVGDVIGKVAVTATILGGIYWGVTYYFDENKRLKSKKVKIDWDKIPHYDFKEVKKIAQEIQAGKHWNWGSARYKILQGYNYMLRHKIKRVYWKPDRLIRELYSTMKGVNFPSGIISLLLTPISPTTSFFSSSSGKPTDPREKAWAKLLSLNNNQLRLLHNKWIDTSSEGSSFYDWVNSEWSSSNIKTKLIARLNTAGVGKNVYKKKM